MAERALSFFASLLPGWVSSPPAGPITFAEQERLDNQLIAAQKGHLPVLQCLLNRDARIANLEDGHSALHEAAFAGHVEIIQALLDHGANINAADIYEQTSLFLAASTGKLPTVEYLLDHGANINALTNNRLTALSIAAQKGHLPVLQCLLNHGADPVIGFPTVRLVHAQTNKLGFLEELFKATQDFTLEQLAAFCHNPSSLDFASLDVVQKSSLLRYAALAGSDQGVMALLAHGASADTQCAFNMSPRACAIIGGIGPQAYAKMPSGSRDDFIINDHENGILNFLSKKYNFFHAQHRSMTLLLLAAAAVRRMVTNTAR